MNEELKKTGNDFEKVEPMNKAEKYSYEWLTKKYGGSKDIGDWIAEDVIQFATDFAEK